jgi:hypothetical protein
MNDLKIEATKGLFFSPSVYFQAKTGLCELSGESYIEDAPTFYSTPIQWINDFEGKRLIFSFKLTYFNTSSSKSILDLLKALKSAQLKGTELAIKWYYPEDNYDLLAEAEDFMDDTELIFNMIPYQLSY